MRLGRVRSKEGAGRNKGKNGRQQLSPSTLLRVRMTTGKAEAEDSVNGVWGVCPSGSGGRDKVVAPLALGMAYTGKHSSAGFIDNL